MTTRRIALLALALLLIALPAAADEPSPSRPISIVVPFPPGGIADLTARPLAAAMERLVKQPVVITNKAGAGGAVGTQSVAIARPDGYTLLLGLVSISLLPERDLLFGQKPAYTREQFIGIARLNADPPVLAVNAELGKHAALWASPPALTLPHVKAGKMRVLATWGSARLAAFPDVPTLKELGYDVEYYLWAGLFTPKGTPPAVVKALRDAVRQSVQDPEFRSAMEKAQTPIAYQDADEFKAWWDKDAQTLAEVVKRIGKRSE